MDTLSSQYDHPDCNPADEDANASGAASVSPCGWADLELGISNADGYWEDLIDRAEEAHLETGE
jgi:hypothetical protein